MPGHTFVIDEEIDMTVVVLNSLSDLTSQIVLDEGLRALGPQTGIAET